MNKIKVIYDAVKKMKEKDTVKGTFTAEGLKGENKIFSMNNTFEKSTKDGQTKGKTSIEVDCEGKKMKLENSIDFQGDGCKGHHPHFMKHMHECHHGVHGGGFKEGLGRITAMLGILSSMKLSEKEVGVTVLSLDSADLPEDVRNSIHEKMKKGCEHHKQMAENSQHQMCMKAFHGMDNAAFTFKLFINNDSEIEKVLVTVKGDKIDENNTKEEMQAAAELNLQW